jgi:hypothetical protein
MAFIRRDPSVPARSETPNLIAAAQASHEYYGDQTETPSSHLTTGYCGN